MVTTLTNLFKRWSSVELLWAYVAMDFVGFQTMYNIIMNAVDAGSEQASEWGRLLKENFIGRGKLGTWTGEGFYKYPNPAFESPDFLR